MKYINLFVIFLVAIVSVNGQPSECIVKNLSIDFKGPNEVSLKDYFKASKEGNAGKAYVIVQSSEEVRVNVGFLENFDESIDPNTHGYIFDKLKQAFESSPNKLRFAELLNPNYQLVEGANRWIETDPITIQQASDNISTIRSQNGISSKRNIAYLQGQIDGIGIIDALDNYRVSNDPLNSNPIFEPSFVKAHVRDTDSEFKILDDLAKELGATSSAEEISGFSGTLQLVSENPFCASCSRIITEFSNIFPGIDLTLVNGVL